MTDGDKERFERLYRQNFRAVLRYALARLEPERAKDATAETFLIAWRRLPDLPAEPSAWLFGVARKVIASQLRGDARRKALTTRLSVLGEPSDGPADPAREVAERDSVLTALSRLAERDREILLLVTWDELPPDLAAVVLGVSQSTFNVRIHRARRRFAAELAKDDPGLGPDHGTALCWAPDPISLPKTKEAR
jgi:RNA polymerase sigma factor (sigma-70 family)